MKDENTSFQEQEKYEHVCLKVTSTKDGKRSQDDEKRLYLIDDLKEAQVHIGSLLLMLTNKGWIDGNGSNPGGGFRKPGGGLEARSGRDGLEGPDGILSKVVVQHGLVLETHLVMMKRCSVRFC
nr:hypothetical protein [Tanacetum cinerariifolium]